MTQVLNAAVREAGLPGHWPWRVEVRPRRRTLGLDVLPDGTIVIAVPTRITPDELTNALQDRRLWLARAIRRRAELAADHPAKELVDGEGFTYLGRHYRLLRVAAPATPVRLRGGWLQLSSEAGGPEIIEWYRTRGQAWLTERVRSWAGRVGVEPPHVVVRDLATRWGLRTRDGSVAFHWATIQLPPDLLDLVVVHELVHLVVPRHDEEFRRRLMIALPEAAALEARLGEEGRRAWMGTVRDL
ncbi:M48 family metallopeptidase [Lentzea alba]|uniref:M48 family metallopeptidase n=1 Tax=Lentzea alba TaxID=2714351 RepID=UPI0039BF7640